MKRLVLFLMLLLGCSSQPASAGDAKEKKPTANLVFDVSGRLVNALAQQNIDRIEPMRETIQDTPVDGMSRTIGIVAAELIPDSKRASVEVYFRGQVLSNAIGRRPFVDLYTTTVTPIEVRRRITIDGMGIRTFAGPSFGESTTTLLDVRSRAEPDALAIWLNRRLFPRDKAAAEEETTCKTALNLSSRMSEELTPRLADGSKAIADGLTTLKQLGLSLEALEFETTAAFLEARLRIATPHRAPPRPMPSLPADIDLGARIHESLVNEAAERVYGGRSFALDQVNKFYDEVTSGLLRDGRKDPLQNVDKLLAKLAGERTVIVLAKVRPITFTFVDQGFSVEIHVASIEQQGIPYAGLRVKAEFKLENTMEGVLAVRQGPVRLTRVKPAPGDNLKPAPGSFQLFEEVLFGEVLKERLILSAAPTTAALGNVRLGPPRAGARDGWLGFVWNLAPAIEVPRKN